MTSAREAKRWNESRESVYIEKATRETFMSWFRPRKGLEIANIGIGVWAWDDFLGHWLGTKGRLLSVDRDRSICRDFQRRQKEENHPFPSRVLPRSLFSPGLRKRSFDRITMIGSTANETGNPARAVAACLALLKPGGLLFLMDFDRFNSRSVTRERIRASGGAIVREKAFKRGTPFSFYCFKIKS